MKKHKRLLAVLLVFIFVVSMAPIMVSAEQVSDFPLRAKSGDLVADDNTRYITLAEQDPLSKLITVTVWIKHSGMASERLAIQGFGIGIFYSEKVAPYAFNTSSGSFDPGRLFAGRLYPKNAAEIAVFNEYCSPLINGFDSLGSRLIQNDAGSGMIGAMISSSDVINKPALIVEPGQTIGVIDFYFMPKNGADELDIDMFSYGYYNENFPDVIRVAPTISNGTCSVQALGKHMTLTSAYIVSPDSFKLQVRRPAPDVSADNAARAIAGYDADTMEWSDSEYGSYSDGRPDIGDGARTIYVRLKGDAAYSGADGIYGAYKKYVASAPTRVVFGAPGVAEADIALDAQELEAEAIDEDALEVEYPDQLEDIELDADGTCEPVASVDISSSNQTSDDGLTRPGDVIEYEILISNEGEDDSVWADAILIDAISIDVTLDESSIKVSSGVEYKYDYDTRILSVILGAIKTGRVKKIKFTVTVNEDAFGARFNNSATVLGRDGEGEAARGLNVIADEQVGYEVEATEAVDAAEVVEAVEAAEVVEAEDIITEDVSL